MLAEKERTTEGHKETKDEKKEMKRWHKETKEGNKDTKVGSMDTGEGNKTREQKKETKRLNKEIKRQKQSKGRKLSWLQADHNIHSVASLCYGLSRYSRSSHFFLSSRFPPFPPPDLLCPFIHLLPISHNQSCVPRTGSLPLAICQIQV